MSNTSPFQLPSIDLNMSLTNSPQDELILHSATMDMDPITTNYENNKSFHQNNNRNNNKQNEEYQFSIESAKDFSFKSSTPSSSFRKSLLDKASSFQSHYEMPIVHQSENTTDPFHFSHATLGISSKEYVDRLDDIDHEEMPPTGMVLNNRNNLPAYDDTNNNDESATTTADDVEDINNDNEDTADNADNDDDDEGMLNDAIQANVSFAHGQVSPSSKDKYLDEVMMEAKALHAQLESFRNELYMISIRNNIALDSLAMAGAEF